MEGVLGDTLLVSSKDKSTGSTSELLGTADIIGLYFSASWCGPCQEFTPRLAKFYEDQAKKAGGLSFKVVFVSADRKASDMEKYYGKMPFYALPYDLEKMMSLSKKYKVEGYPTLVLLDGQTLEVITDAAVMKVYMDAKGEKFPWRPKSLNELLGSQWVNNAGEKLNVADIQSKYLGIYFSASWCPPCQRFTPELAKFYQDHAQSLDLEIVFASRDENEKEWAKYFKKMPWWAMPFADTSFERGELGDKYKVRGIPCLVILDKETRQVITTEGVRSVMKDKTGAEFPWRPKSLEELDGYSIGAVQENVSVIGFANSIVDDAKREAFVSQLQAAADDLKSEEDQKSEPVPAKFFYVKRGGDARLEAAMKGIMGIKTDDVFIAVIDLQNGVCFHSKLTASCSKEDILTALRSFLAGEVEFLPLQAKR